MTSPSEPSRTESSGPGASGAGASGPESPGAESPGPDPAGFDAAGADPAGADPSGTDSAGADPAGAPVSSADRRGGGAGLVGCVFVGTSLDGFIARENGALDWLTAAGAALGETGYDEFFASVDALVLGRSTFETVSGFAQWPYPGKRVLVLSRTLAISENPLTIPSAGEEPAESAEPAEPAVTVHASLDDVVATLTAEGHRRVYVDGGRTIQSFLRAGLIREITITRAPVLIGSGIPLFGPLSGDVHLRHVGTRELGAWFTQSSYEVLAEG